MRKCIKPTIEMLLNNKGRRHRPVLLSCHPFISFIKFNQDFPDLAAIKHSNTFKKFLKYVGEMKTTKLIRFCNSTYDFPTFRGLFLCLSKLLLFKSKYNNNNQFFIPFTCIFFLFSQVTTWHKHVHKGDSFK